MGRSPEGGQVFYIGRVRWQEWHGERLYQFLERFCAVGQNEKLEMLDQLLKGSGFDPNLLAPANEAGETQETAEFMNGFLL